MEEAPTGIGAAVPVVNFCFSLTDDDVVAEDVLAVEWSKVKLNLPVNWRSRAINDRDGGVAAVRAVVGFFVVVFRAV